MGEAYDDYEAKIFDEMDKVHDAFPECTRRRMRTAPLNTGEPRCTKCGVRFTSIKEWQEHAAKHRSENQK